MAASYIDEALRTHAFKQTAITDIVSRKIYMIKAPGGAQRPYVTQRIIFPENLSEKFGEKAMGQPLFQWTCVSDANKTPPDAFLVAHALMDTFRYFSGTMEGITVDFILVYGPRELVMSGSQDIHCIVEAEVHYVEP